MSAFRKPKLSLTVAMKITLIYIAVGSIWIYYSDQFLLTLTRDTVILSQLQSYKGWFYVLGSAALLYILIRAMTGDIDRAHQRTAAANQATITALLRAIELRDMHTEGHSQRVTRMTMRLARELRYPPGKMDALSQGALLHDIGKIGVPDRILGKPGKLTPAEWVQMKQHSQRGYELVRSVEHLKEAATVPNSHHERWDGSGYPRGLRGESIPLEARIFAVADVWDALTSKRPYRPAWSEKRAYNYIVENAGILFDPRVVDAFKKLRQRRRL